MQTNKRFTFKSNIYQLLNFVQSHFKNENTTIIYIIFKFFINNNKL